MSKEEKKEEKKEKPKKQIITVQDLRDALAGLPRDAKVYVEGRAILEIVSDMDRMNIVSYLKAAPEGRTRLAEILDTLPGSVGANKPEEKGGDKA